jgi:hypothetical protein
MPTLRMAMISRFAVAARPHVAVIPPIFGNCTLELTADAEREARALYWKGATADATCDEPAGLDAVRAATALSDLAQASELNPFVGEPHIVRAQLLMQVGRWEEAAAAATTGLHVLCAWATQWDNRMPFGAWVAWARCIVLQAGLREWPTSHGGMESLGAVHPSQRFRGLNAVRSIAKQA